MSAFCRVLIGCFCQVVVDKVSMFADDSLLFQQMLVLQVTTNTESVFRQNFVPKPKTTTRNELVQMPLDMNKRCVFALHKH